MEWLLGPMPNGPPRKVGRDARAVVVRIAPHAPRARTTVCAGTKFSLAIGLNRDLRHLPQVQLTLCVTCGRVRRGRGGPARRLLIASTTRLRRPPSKRRDGSDRQVDALVRRRLIDCMQYLAPRAMAARLKRSIPGSTALVQALDQSGQPCGESKPSDEPMGVRLRRNAPCRFRLGECDGSGCTRERRQGIALGGG